MPSFVRNVSWSFAGAATYNACQWLTLISIARLTTPALAGDYIVVLAIVGPVFLLANLQLPALLATDAGRRFPTRIYVSLRLAALIVAALFLVWLSRTLHSGLGGAVALFALARAIDGFAEIAAATLQREQQLRHPAQGLLINGTGTLVFSLAALGRFPTITALGVASATGSLIAATYIISAALRTRGRLTVNSPQPARSLFCDLLRQSTPLGIVAALLSLNGAMPSYFLRLTHGSAAVGVFGAIGYPLLALTMVIGAVTQAGAPQLAAAYARGDVREFDQIMKRMLIIGGAIGAVCIVGGVALGRIGLTLLYGPEYGSAYRAFAILCLATGIRFGFVYIGVGMTVVRILTPQIYIRLTALTVLGVGLFTLVPIAGLSGAAAAVLLATIAESVFWLNALRTMKQSFTRRAAMLNPLCVASSGI